MGDKITSHNQSGGITAKNVTVSREPSESGEPPNKNSRRKFWITVISAFGSIATILTYLGIKPMSKDKDEPKVVVQSISQSGGITAHTVNVNAAPKPSVTSEILFVNKPQGPQYVSQILLKIDSPYTPSKLVINVTGSSIKSIDMFPEEGGVMANHPRPKGVGFFSDLSESSQTCDCTSNNPQA